MEADPAHERGTGVAGSSRVAREVNPEFEPDRRDRMVSLAEYPVYRSSAANEPSVLMLVGRH